MHQYSNGAGEGASSGIVLGVRIDDMTSDFSISDMYMENDEFYMYFTEHLHESNTYSLRERTIEEITEGLIDELYDLRDEMLEVEADQIADVRPVVAEVQPYVSTYSYSGYTGAAYANRFYSTPNTYFYTATYDCTNFVSQCVWAAYGGWYSNISDSVLANNISNKVRMTSSWYAGSGGGSSSWENVDNLWNYVVGNSGNGPKAYGYNNGNHYSFIEPVDIAVGDVLQKSSTGVDYFHSLYVIEVPGGSNPSYTEIVLAQHTYNRKITLAETISIGGTYIRQMQFTSNTFDK